MYIVLKLYKYVDGIIDTPFPNEKEQAMFTFQYDTSRMADAPRITATLKHRLCLDDLWEDNVYAEFNGEKYFIINTPSSSKDNTDERYKHEIELLSERDILNHVYFIDAVQGDSEVDKNKSNSTKIQFNGDINELCGRLNACFSYFGLDYSAVVDEGVTSEDKLVSFEDKYILSALQESFNIYEIPYYFVGKTLHFGESQNTIDHVFKYGIDESLISISKNNANYEVINKIKGQGSSDNIPYYYPNNSPKGDIGIKVVSGNLNSSNIKIYDYEKFSRSMSLTDVCVVKRVSVSTGIYNYVWTINEEEVNLDDIGVRLADMFLPEDGSSFMQELISYITPMTNLMPSIYRQTNGEEQFYEAKNDTYTDEEGNFYEFSNIFSESNQRQGTTNFDDIKPTIKEMTNSLGQRIDMFSEFAYDENDNDEVDDDGNYVHPYFFAKLRKFDGDNGFNLFDQAIESQTMQFSFTSGVCGSCTFELGVGEETNKNIVQVDDSGNIKRDENGNVLWENQFPQDRQNDTRNYEVWIALKKDSSTYSKVMPNVYQNLKPSIEDTFVILGINLPIAYITAAEKKLEDSLIKYMWLNNEEKFTFDIKFSRIFLKENPEILNNINENSRIIIEYNNKQHALYIENFSYKTDENNILPEIEVSLVDTISIGENSLKTQLDSVKQDILSSIKGDFLQQGLRYFLRKDVSDTANGFITFNKGINTLNATIREIARTYDLDVSNVATLFKTVIKNELSSENYISGFTGEGMKLWQAINGDWNLELDNVTIRKAFYVFEMVVQKVRSVNGALAITQGNGTIKSVSETAGDPAYYVCGIEGDMTFEAGDFVRCQVFSASRLKYYWVKIYQITGNSIYLLKSDFSTDIPESGDEIVQIGNDTNPNRQSVLYLSASEDGKPRFSVLDGVNSPSFVGKTKAVFGYIGDIIDSSFPAEHQPSGYGLYCQNAFLSGIFVLSNGKSIEDEIGNINTQIIAIPGLISSSVTEEVSKIEIGGRNLVLKSDQIFTARINTKTYDMSKTWLSLKGKTVAISFDYSYTNATTDSSNHILWFEKVLDTDTGTSYALSRGISLPITSTPISGSGRYTGTAVVPSNIVSTSTAKVATLIIKMTGGSGTITNFKIEEGNKSTDWSPAPEDAKIYTDDVINNLQIGGRNLLPDSKDVSDTPYLHSIGYTAAYRNLTRTLNAGETVIFSYSGVTSNSVVGFALYSLNSSIDVFPVNTPVTLTKSYTYFRVRVSTSAAFAADYMKLEVGTKATDWTPAPEDVQAELDSKVAVTVYESGITQLQSSIDSKVSQTNFDALGNRVSAVETEIVQTPNKITQAIKETSIGGDNLLPNLQQRWARGRINSGTGAIEVPSGTGWSYVRINIYCAEFFPVNGGETLVFSAPTDKSYTCFPAQYDASKKFIPVAPEQYYMRNYYDESQPDNLKSLTLKPQTRYVRWQIQCSYGSETGDFYPSWFETNHAQVEIGTKPSAYKTPFTDVTYTGIDVQQGKIWLTADKVEITGALIVKGIQNGGINVGGNCIITSTGLITAKGATIEGKITATSGSIGGVSISNNRIGIDSSSTSAVGSFLAAGYLGVRSKANYFRVDANDTELQCTINKKSDTTPCIDIKNTSTSGGSTAAMAMRTFGKNELYGGIQILSASDTIIEDNAPKLEITKTDFGVTLRVNNTGEYVSGYLRITSSPATGGAATVQFVRD